VVTIQLWWASMLSGYASDDFPHSSGFATSETADSDPNRWFRRSRRSGRLHGVEFGVMLALYLFCAALGIPLLAMFAFGSSESDADFGDAGFDIDADVGVDLDFGGADGGFGDFTGMFRRIPISSYAFFLAFFGGAGTVGTWLDVGFIRTIVLAVTLGVIAAAVNAAAFSFLRNTDMTSQLSDHQMEGRLATVSVPIDAGKRGRVWLDTGEERVQLTAGSIESALDQRFERGEQVVIVEITNGVAKVMGVDPEILG